MEKVSEEKGLYDFFVESAGLNVASSFSLQSPILAIEAAKKIWSRPFKAPFETYH